MDGEKHKQFPREQKQQKQRYTELENGLLTMVSWTKTHTHTHNHYGTTLHRASFCLFDTKTAARSDIKLHDLQITITKNL